MKKLYLILVTLLILFLNINNINACKFIQEWKEIPDNFQESCYEFSWEIKNSILFEEREYQCWYRTFLISSDYEIDTFLISDNSKILPHKLYKSAWENLNYKVNLDWNIKYLQDENYKTFLELDTDIITELILELDDEIKAGSSKWVFKYESKNYFTEYYISKDWIKYSKINISYYWPELDLWDFNFKFLKIKFIPNNPKNTLREKIKVSELILKNINYKYLVKTTDSIKAYSNNLCKDSKYLDLSNTKYSKRISEYMGSKKIEFNLNKDTQNITLDLKENKDFNIYKEQDSDNDWILNSQDNCKNIYNPKQTDNNWNNIWDLCEDQDNDWIIWNKDNCINIYNPNQEDINSNNIWDKCEFDKDKDWVFDNLDNCINTYNPEQFDTDKDWIWDKCDNCKLYNPRQLDKNNNKIWDKCEQEDEYLFKNDKDKDKILDSKDNCENIYNPEQLDKDKDWVWDKCDNCLSIQNFKQVDLNNNSIWDMCEDQDNDWIEWYLDNCISIANPNQVDSDNNKIWDLCEDKDYDKILFKNDNCPYDYNPDQSDIDSDNIWDKCDNNDSRFIESNKNLFIGLLVFIALLFLFWIYKMVGTIKDKG